MDFDDILDEISQNLGEEKRISYRRLQRRYDLTDEDIEDIKDELIAAKGIALDENNKILVWNNANIPKKPTITERRHLTVVFFDLVDSTKLLGALEIEDFRDIILAYQRTVVSAITPYKGYIAQYLGDGVLVYFGYPNAREHAAQDALEGSLDVLETFKETAKTIHQQFGIEPKIRIGIQTGVVVIGDVGVDSQTESIAIGDTPNIAARLQSLAEPNQIIVGEDTFALTESFFRFRDRGELELKGIANPVRAYDCVERLTERSKYQVLLHKKKTMLQGREQELNVLVDQWKQVQSGESSAAFIEGEGGIGKSRLILELSKKVSEKRGNAILIECSPFHQGTYLYPIIRYLQTIFGFTADDDPRQRERKLASTLRKYDSFDEQGIHLFASLLSIDSLRSSSLNITPQKLRQLTRLAVIDLMHAEAARKPCLFIFEDLHWSDPSTLEILSHFVAEPIPLSMIILTSRPGLTHDWVGVNHIQLGQMSMKEAEAMVYSVDEHKILESEFVKIIIEKADGIPLFIEELTHAVISQQQSIASGKSDVPVQIPNTLRDSLFSRLDGLPNGKAVAQLSSVIGRDFSQELLDSIWGKSSIELQTGLHELTGSGLLEQHREDGKLIYSFKHALIRDTAYESLLLKHREEFHLNIAEKLETQFNSIIASQPEILAHHYGAAKKHDMALEYWILSSNRAQKRSAHKEAISLLDNALASLELTSETDNKIERKLHLLNQKGSNLVAVNGYASASVGELYTSARDLCADISDDSLRFDTMSGLWMFYVVKADLEDSLSLSGELLELAEKENDPAFVLEALLRQGISLSMLGNLNQAKENFQKVLSLYDAERDREHLLRYGQDPRISCLCHYSLVLWLLGYPDQALSRSEEACKFALELDHPFSLSWAYFYSALIRYLRNEPEESNQAATRLINLCTEQAFSYRLAQGRIITGWADQSAEGGADLIRNSLSAVRATGALIYSTYYYAILSEVEGRHSFESANAAIDEGLGIASKTEENIFQAELLRIKASLLAKSNSKLSAALKMLDAAQDLAKKQGSRSLELRISTSRYALAKSPEAKRNLEVCMQALPEGKELKDYQEAVRLLSSAD